MTSRAGRPAPSRAHGFTLAELVVALGIGGAVLGAFALAVAHQERVYGELARRVRARAALREGLAPLLADLRTISPAAGDLKPGHASDSAVELRTTIGSVVVCEIAGRTLTGALASFVTQPKTGDTAWAYVASDTGQAWMPLPIQGAVVHPAESGILCPFPARGASALPGGRASHAWYALELLHLPPGLAIGTPLRVTRPARYSLYRAPDSKWYLGRREWSPARGLFETIQPVSGPYRPYAPPGEETSGLELHYSDSAGAEVPIESATSGEVAHVTLVLRTAGDGRVREGREATSVTFALRNPP